MDASRAVDEFLRAACRTGLEEALCGGCLMGRLGKALSRVASITPVLMRSIVEDDGGVYSAYEGTLGVQGITYVFQCHIFVDRGGQRFLTDVTDFRPIGWQARIAVPGR